MPCNAVATATARVPVNQMVTELLDEKTAQGIMLVHLKNKFGSADLATDSLGAVIGCPGFVVFYRGGALSITSLIDRAYVDEIADELSALLEQAAGIVFQESVKNHLARIGFIESEVTTPEGALVLTMDI